MTTQQKQQEVEAFVPADELTALSTPNLDTETSRKLLDCINDVRQGRKVFYVRVTNRKVTKSRKRLPQQDYKPDPGLAPHAHEGLLVKAPLNRKGEVYLHILDEARVPETCPKCGETLPGRQCPKCGAQFGHTRVTMRGILSFKVLGDMPGPLAEQEEAKPLATAEQIRNLLAFQAQNMTMQAQAMFAMAMGLQQQAQQIQQMLAQQQGP